MKGDLRINFSSQVKNTVAFQSNAHSRVNVAISFKAHETGRGTVAEKVVATVQGEVIEIFDDGIYFKVNNADFKAEGVHPGEREHYQNARQELRQAVDEFKNTWFYVCTCQLESLTGTNEINSFIDETFIAQSLRKKGIKATYKEVVKRTLNEQLASGLINEEVANAVTALMNRVFETELFRIKTINQGHNKGFQAFNLNRRGIINILQEVTRTLGKSPSQRELNDVNQLLNLFTISGFYRVNQEHDLYDNFLLRLGLKDIKILKYARLMYRYKISRINQSNMVTAPIEFIEIGDAWIKKLEKVLQK